MEDKQLQHSKILQQGDRIRYLANAVWPYAFLTALTCALMFLPVEEGCIFGSEGDWYSQHVGAAEALRQTMLETKSLLPSWIGVGGAAISTIWLTTACCAPI